MTPFQPPSPEAIAEAQRQQQVTIRMILDEYRKACQFAAIVCTCPRRFHHGSDWFQEMHNCPVHGRYLIIPEEYLRP